MASTPQAQADSVLSAVSSVSTCSSATVVLLKNLLVPSDATVPTKPLTANETRATKTTRTTKASTAKTPAKKTEKAEPDGLTPKERAVVATKVVNATLKTLGDAAKPAPAAAAQLSAEPQGLAKKTSRAALRRSSSAPMTPLNPRTLNRTSSSPTKPAARPTSSSSAAATARSNGCLAVVECARVAFSALRGLQAAGETKLPELQLENGLSALASRLVAVGMLDQAAKELRHLKQRLDTLLGSSIAGAAAPKKKTARAAQPETAISVARVSDILDFGGIQVKDAGAITELIISTQLLALRVLSLMKKPQHTQPAVEYLKDPAKTSPLDLLLASVECGLKTPDKAARQLETFSQLLLSLSPSVSSKADAEACEPRLNISPSAAFEVHVLGLEARTHWWSLAGHKGDVDKDIIQPLWRCLGAYVRRKPAADESLYLGCADAVQRVVQLAKDKGFKPTESFKSPLASLYQALGAMARESKQYQEAASWIKRLKALLQPNEDSDTSRCSVAALLLSIQLKDAEQYAESESLLREVLDGIQGVLKGNTSDLEGLLTNVNLARRSVMNALVDEEPIPTASKGLMEELVLQCPKFCLRWLGKPIPASGSTKDFVSYEQRRQTLATMLQHMLDSAFLVIKMHMDEKRVSWAQMDSILADCLTILEYMGDAAPRPGSPGNSVYVKMSLFHWIHYSTLAESSKDPKDPEPLRALRRSIECVKHRPAAEKEKTQFAVKLERMAELCQSMGRISEALGALQTLRSALIEDGALDEVVEASTSLPPALAWKCSSKAANLSRILTSIWKLEQIWIDWSVDLTEPEQLSVREHRLHFILMKSDRTLPTMTDKTVESLLTKYYPTRHPICRLRTLLCLFVVHLDSSDELPAIESQIEAVVGLIKKSGFGEDSALSSYMEHYRAYYKSLSAMKSQIPDLDRIEQSIHQWKTITEACSTPADLDSRIDDASHLVRHLQSIIDFSKAMGQDSLQLSTLELLTKISGLLEDSDTDTRLASNSRLALLYASTGRSSLAQKALDAGLKFTQEREVVSRESVANFHLAFAEFQLFTGNLNEAEVHFKQAQKHAADTSNSPMARSQRRDLITYASLLQSMIASKKGEAHHALIHARETVRILFREWTKLERAASSSSTSDQANESQGSISLVASMAGAPSPESGESTVTVAGPEFWKLFYPLFRSLSHLSSVYAHLGMFQETVYYAEQAQKLAQTTGARLYLAQCESWMASVYLRAGKLQRSLELANLSSSKLLGGDQSCTAVALACQLGGLYRDLKEFEAELRMIQRAEDTLIAIDREVAEVVGKDAEDEDQEQPSSRARKGTVRTARLPIREKPAARQTTRKAAVTTTTTRRTTKKAPPAVEGTTTSSVPAPSESTDIIISTLKASIAVHKAVSFVNKKDWNSAKETLQTSQALTKLARGKLGEMLAQAMCHFGQCQEQMTRDAVFSVIQDSTLSFPAVCKGASDRSSPAKPTQPQKGRSAASAASKRHPDFLVNLQAAHDCLVEAHSIAVVSGDAAMVHRIAVMLQSTVLILSATGTSKPRLLGSQDLATCSVEAAQNLTWRRERKALLLEKHAIRNEALEWPMPVSLGDASPGGRLSLAPVSDMSRFQRDYIDIIPKDWTVISVSLSDNKHDLCISRLQAGHSPFVIRLPLERATSRDTDNESFNYQTGRAELLEIIELANASCHDARDMSAKGAKTAWWSHREELDERLKNLLDNVEQVWLGGFKGIFSQQKRCSELLARFQKSFTHILDKHLPSRKQVWGKRSKAASASASTANKVTLDPRILELFVGLGDVTDSNCGDLDDALNDLLYFVVDILQFHGEPNAYDEIDFDAMSVDTFDALHSYYTAMQERKGRNGSSENRNAHTVLVLDKALHVFPWESLPCMEGHAVSRVPSLECLRRLLLDRKRPEATAEDHPNPPVSGRHVSRNSGTWILNPGGDLKTTQTTFETSLASSLGKQSNWHGMVGRVPTESEFEDALRSREVLLYFGHGSGAQYIRGRTVRRLQGGCRAAVLLWGCSSASLAEAGDFETHGPVWNYLMAGCPAVTGTLWDVTDRDIDRLAVRVFEEWGLVGEGVFKEEPKAKGGKRTAATATGGRDVPPAAREPQTSLVQAVSKARDVCRFKYLTAAAVCVYGIPVYLNDE
ncbi:separin [Pyricularia oryzae]|nr:separin [Pyricularia oryzae]